MVFEIRVLRKLFGSRVNGGVEKTAYSSPNIDWEMISRMRCKGHVTLLVREGGKEMHIGIW